MTRKIHNIDGYRYKSAERLSEVKNTLKWNTQWFDEIHVWCQEKLDYEAFKDMESEKVILHDLDRLEPISMQDLYNFANSVSNPEDFKFFANSDTTFGPKIVDYDCPENYFIIFSNRSMRDPSIGQGPDAYKHSENDGLVLFNRDGVLDPNWFQNDDSIRPMSLAGHCGWSWKTPKVMNSVSPCYLGTQGGENCFLNYILSSGFDPRLGVVKYPTYHNHRTNERTNRHNTVVYGSHLTLAHVL